MDLHVALEGALLCEGPPAYGAHEPLVVVVDPQVFPKGLLALVRLLAHVARVYPLAVVLDHVHLQGVSRVEGEITLVALVVALVQVIAAHVTGQMAGRYVALGAHLALIPFQFFIVDLSEMLLPGVERC